MKTSLGFGPSGPAGPGELESGPSNLESAVVRFAGDSGDGMQLTGGQFTLSTALAGNDLATFPDFPAEIRAPQGTTFGVSAFQINFGSTGVETAGDEPDVLIAMNPAALKINLPALSEGAMIIVDGGDFTRRNLSKAGYDENPLLDGSLDSYSVLALDISRQTTDAVKPFGLGNKDALRCRNMWTLGLVLWMFGRDRAPLLDWIGSRFAGDEALRGANIAALNAGHAFGETAELGEPIRRYHVKPVVAEPGVYRTVTGAESLALGLVTGARLAALPMVFASYPITPASPILHTLTRLREFDVKTFQAEDEIAAICAAIGASYAGNLGVTSSSGPGMALKTEALGLAVMTELPLVVVNSQRGGPSTGLPTKTEQSDLYQAVYGRNGDAPLVVLAARSPTDAFDVAIEACRLATEFMTPVILMTDGYIANSAEPWKIPRVEDYTPFPAAFHTRLPLAGKQNPYERDPHTLRRIWIKPGTPGLTHRIGGLERSSSSGHINYEPANHQKMTDARKAKIDGIARCISEQEVALGKNHGRVAVVGWGSTFGPIHEAVRRARQRGRDASHIHIRHLWPLPPNLGPLLRRYDLVLVPEMNTGQLKTLLRDQFLIDARSITNVSGQPFKIAELGAAIEEVLV